MVRNSKDFRYIHIFIFWFLSYCYTHKCFLTTVAAVCNRYRQ